MGLSVTDTIITALTIVTINQEAMDYKPKEIFERLQERNAT